MANEKMRIFFPLKIFSYPQYDCSEDEREDISPREAVALFCILKACGSHNPVAEHEMLIYSFPLFKVSYVLFCKK